MSTASSASCWSLTPGQVDDHVRALDAHVGLGDAALLELVADQVADDDQVVVAGALGRGEDHRHAAAQVEAEHRRVAQRQVERRAATRQR